MNNGESVENGFTVRSAARASKFCGVRRDLSVEEHVNSPLVVGKHAVPIARDYADFLLQNGSKKSDPTMIESTANC